MIKLFEKFKKELFGDEFVCLNCGRERVFNNHHYLCDKCFGNLSFINLK